MDQEVDQVIAERLTKMGVATNKCKHCEAEIFWLRTTKGKFMPVQMNLIPHWSECPGSNQARRRDNVSGI